jgi:hypothetical protein
MILRIFSFFSFFLSFLNYSSACNLSSVYLVNISGTGPYTVEIQICVGYGGNGATSGAGGNTGNINIALYGDSTMTLNSFSPSYLIGPVSGDTLTGSNVGALTTPIVSGANLAYSNASGVYACVGSPATCGSTSQSCFNVSVVLSSFPDSLRVFGLEGNSSLTSGCSNDSDMLLTFSAYLPVSWLSFNAKLLSMEQVSLDWTVATEQNCDRYEIQRTEILEHHPHWEKVGEIKALNQMDKHSYNFIDINAPSEAYYRIIQYDYDGRSSKTHIVYVKQDETWYKVYPNPASEVLIIESGKEGSFSLIDPLGKVKLAGLFTKNKPLQIALSDYNSGLYFLRLTHDEGSEVKTIFVYSP